MKKQRKREFDHLMGCFESVKKMMEEPHKTDKKEIERTTNDVKNIFHIFTAQKGDVVIRKKDIKTKVNSLFEELDSEIKRSGL